MNTDLYAAGIMNRILNPEGWIVTDEDLKDIPGSFNLYKIPEEYQDQINIFKCDFWDGEIVLERID